MDDSLAIGRDSLIAYVPWRPLIKATIRKGNEWELTSRTRANTSNLTVLEGTMLTLICLSSYPIFWYRKNSENGTLRVQQNRTCNPFFDQDLKFCSNIEEAQDQQKQSGGNTIPILDQYQAVIHFETVTRALNWTTYICQGKPGDELRQTSVQLSIRAFPKKQAHPQILQSEFSNIELPMKEAERYIFNFVFLSYPNSSSAYSLLCSVPSRKLTYSSGPMSMDNSELPTFEMQPGNVTTISFNPNLPEQFFSAWCSLQVNEVSIDESILLTSIEIIKNGTLSRNTNGISWTYLLPADGVFAVILTILSPMFVNQTHVLISEISQTARKVSRYAQCNDRAECLNTCSFSPVTASSAKRCGIVSVAMTQPVSDGQWSAELIIKPTKPCEVTFDGMFIIGYEPSMATDLKVGVTTSLRFSVEEKQYFDWDSNGIVIVAMGQRIEVYEQERLTVQCILTSCREFRRYGWCLIDDTLCDDPVSRFVSLDYNITAYYIDECTIGTNLTFPSIQKFHSGIFRCSFIFYDPVPKTVVKSIDITVLNSTAPRFPDQQDTYTEIRMLSWGNDASKLECPVEGTPSPTYSWFIKNGIDFRTLNFSKRTKEVWYPGIYRCIAENHRGRAVGTFIVNRDQKIVIVACALGAAVGIAMIMVLVVLMVWRRRSEQHKHAFKALAQELVPCNMAYGDLVDKSIPLNAQAHVLSYDPMCELDRYSFTIKSKVLGMGEFGVVYRGELKGLHVSLISRYVQVCNTPIAIKIPKDSFDPQHHRALVDELKIMCRLSLHVNVLLLIGACTSDIEKRQLFVLTEYCQHGSLRDYLIENRAVFENFEDMEKTVQSFLKFAYQAANGMEHLAGENIIHRDLALRNLLLTETHIVKIADFGMSRRHESVYRKSATSDVPLPIFWMALESLISHQYTQKSDVWSFGIVLWEMFSCGRRPYPDYEPDAIFRAWLRASEQNRLGPPRIVCDEMFDLMRKCWLESPDSRPTFSQCKRQIGQTLENRSRSMYVSVIQDLSDAWRSIPPEILARVRSRRPPPNQMLREETDQRGDLPTDAVVPAINAMAQVPDQPNGQNGDGKKLEENDDGQPSEYVTNLDVEDSVTNSTESPESLGTTRVGNVEETRV